MGYVRETSFNASLDVVQRYLWCGFCHQNGILINLYTQSISKRLPAPLVVVMLEWHSMKAEKKMLKSTEEEGGRILCTFLLYLGVQH